MDPDGDGKRDPDMEEGMDPDSADMDPGSSDEATSMLSVVYRL